MALISPPHGLNLFILHNIRKQVAGDADQGSIAILYRGVLPFIGSIFVVLILVIVFPEIATGLPSQMRK
jgi:TRAP-type C4-dicarboxylate transport system permease large subunit